MFYKFEKKGKEKNETKIGKRKKKNKQKTKKEGKRLKWTRPYI
jgi:hypothetical protein